MKLRRVLEESRLFSGLSSDQLAQLLRSSVLVRYEAGATIWGDNVYGELWNKDSSTLTGLEKGELETVPHAEGGESVVIAVPPDQGRSVGVLAGVNQTFFEKGTSTATLRAKKVAFVWRFDDKLVREAAETHAGLADSFST